ncbi:MAG TPA: FxSxx-COOH system tetratricopeptide repeat protein, partial [Lentzea sp.]
AAVAEPDAEAGERVSLSAGQLETYRRSVGLSPTQIALEAASEDRPWADWVRSQLLAAGAELVEVPRADTALVRIMSGHAVEPPNQAHGLVVDAVVGEEEADEEDGDTGTTVQVRIAGRTEEAARTELLAALSLTPAARSEAATVRYPNRTGKVRRNLPDRLTSFAGRGTALAAMRDRLTPEPAPRTWWLTGQSGSGKTELAKEFAHRFEFDYEHVWWINARDRATITDSLALLAPLLGVAAENQVTDMVLGELGQASEAQRWLLIFDGADDPAVLAGMLPQQGCGHVVVTSRALPGDLDAEVFEVGPFTAAESFGYLRRELLQASGRLLGQIATLCGQEPLALRLARAWIVEREAQLRQDGESTRSAAFRSASEFCAAVAADESASTVRRVFEVVARTLDQSTLGQLVVRVAEVCSFLADDGVAISLLHKTSMLAAVSTAPDGPELEGLELDAVLWHGVRHGLFTVSWGLAGSLTMDRPILAFARELVPESDLAALRARVQEGLAAVAPSEAEIGSPTSAPDLRELRRHIVPSEADASASTTVRRWLVNQTRFLLDNGGPHTWAFALSLCEKMLGNWAEDVEPDLRLRLRSHLNNLHRVLDNRHDSFSPDESLVADLRERHSQDHVRVLLATRGKAHALRVAGRFTEALAEEHATVLMLRQRIGPDHPETLKANNNLALSMFLDGDAAAALELQLENRDRRMKVLGPDHKDVWWSTCSIGIYRRELGDYAGALRALEDAHMRIQTIADIGPRDRMRVDWHKAITLRLSGDPGRAKEYNSETSLEYGRVFGPDHSDTRACKLSLAADNHALGEFDSAAKTAWECYQSYVRRRGAVHLFTYVSQLDYAIFLEASGRDDANALRHATEAREGLVHTLGNAVHPWALAARLAEAVVIGRTDDARRANLALANVHDDCLEFLGAQHPTTKTARANAALDSNVDQWTYVVLDVPEM